MSVFSVFPFIMAGVSFYLAFTQLVYFFHLPAEKRRIYLMFALLALLNMVYDVLQGVIYLPSSEIMSIKIQRFQILLILPITIFIFALVFEFLEIQWRRWSRNFIGLISLVFVVSVVFNGYIFKSELDGIRRSLGFPNHRFYIFEGDLDWLGTLIILLSQASFLILTVITIISFFQAGKDKEARVRHLYIIGALLIFILGMVNDTLVIIEKIHSIYVLEYCFLVILLSAVFAISRELMLAATAREQQQILKEKLLEAEKIESLGRLSRVVAHDLNNFLVPILNTAEFLKIDNNQELEVPKEADKIIEATNKATKLVRKLLDYGQDQELNVEVFDLNDYIEQNFAFFKSSATKDVKVHKQIGQSDRPLLIGVDKLEFDRVIFNLIINAAHAIVNAEGGGSGDIWIKTFCVEDPEGAPLAGLSVKDNGGGIPLEIQSQIFEPFFTTKPRGVGTGLGLSSVFGLVKQQGGHIDFESAPGEGAEFIIYLPVLEGPA